MKWGKVCKTSGIVTFDSHQPVIFNST